MKNIINFLYQYFFKIGAISIVGIIIMMLYFSYSFPYYANDSGFYLNIIRDLKAGNIYYQDINVGYTPIGILSMGIPYFLFGISGKLGALVINHLFILASSVIVYRLGRMLNKTKEIAIFFAVLLYALLLYYDGTLIILEPVTLGFQLLSLYFLTKSKGQETKFIFISGIFLGTAFLSKQYSLILLPAFLFYLFKKPSFLRSIGIITIGGLTPLIILFFFFDGMSVTNYVNHLLGRAVYIDSGTGTGLSYKPFQIPFSQLRDILLINFYVFLVLLGIKSWKLKNDNFIFYGILAISSLSVLYFAAYKHYFQFIIPYFILLVLALFPNGKMRFIQQLVVMSMISIAMLVLAKSSYNDVFWKKKLYQDQQKDIDKVSSLIPQNTRVYLSGLSPSYYYLGNFNSINLSKIGYGFPGYYYPESIIKLLGKEGVLVVNDDYLKKYEGHIHQFQKPIKMNLSTGDYYILKLK